MIKRCLPLLGLAAALGGCVSPTPPEPPRELVAAVDARIARGEIGACCAAAVNGPMLCRGADAKSIFEVASVTKTFTALIAARLWCEGRLDLDAPFTRYLPEHVLAKDGTDVTVRDLASHCGGFSDDWMGQAKIYGNETFPFASDEAYFRRLMGVRPTFARRKAIRYACTNYILLGLVVERASGLDLAAAAKKYVFDPLKMDDTRWRYPADPARCVQIYTHGPRPLGTIGDENARGVSRAIGNAGVFTTLDDLMKYASDLLERRAFEPKCYDLLFTLGFEEGRRRRSFGWDMASGTTPPGWSTASVNHSGYTGQYLAIDPVGRKAAVVLTSLKLDDRAGRSAAYEFRRELCRDLCQ